MHIYRIITDSEGYAVGGILVWSNVQWLPEEKVVALALEMTRLTGYCTHYEARRCTAPRFKIVDGVMIAQRGVL